MPGLHFGVVLWCSIVYLGCFQHRFSRAGRFFHILLCDTDLAQGTDPQHLVTSSLLYNNCFAVNSAATNIRIGAKVFPWHCHRHLQMLMVDACRAIQHPVRSDF